MTEEIKREGIRSYPKIYRLEGYKLGTKTEFPTNEKLVIQEKLDGSNITIEFNKGEDKPRIYSRSQEILEGDKNWGQLIKWVYENKDFKNIQQEINNGELPYNQVKLHGEWLQMAKLKYNHTHKFTFWLFDVFTDNNFKEIEEVERIGKFLNLNVVPIISKDLTLNELAQRLPEFIDNQKTLIPNSDSVREGIVVKTLDGQHRIKFVSAEFKEVVGAKHLKGDKVPSFQFNENPINEARVIKFLNKLREQNKLPDDSAFESGEDKKVIFSNLDMLTEDFIEEEFNNLMESIKKQLKKETGKAVKKYLEREEK